MNPAIIISRYSFEQLVVFTPLANTRYVSLHGLQLVACKL